MEKIVLNSRKGKSVRSFMSMTALAIAVSATSVLASTKTVKMEFSDPLKKGTVKITFTDTSKPDDPKKIKTVSVAIPANTTAAGKRDLILEELGKEGVTASADGATGLTLDAVDKNVDVDFDSGKTAETDVIQSDDVIEGSIAFDNIFDPRNPSGGPAEFQAGIYTDFGSVFAVTNSDELGGQTDGESICAALFDQLAMQAGEIGAQVEYAGNHINVIFMDGVTTEVGGILVGTTSPTEGSGPRLLLGEPQMTLDVDQFIAGNVTTLSVPNADPFTEVYFVYGLGESGDFAVPGLDITLDISQPLLAGSQTSDAGGFAFLEVPIPAGTSGLGVLLQAAQEGEISALRNMIIQ